jgi:ATP-dependent Clp protease protease subunit
MITFKNNADFADIYVYGEITSFPFENTDMSADDFRMLLDEAGGKPLNVYVNSPGGEVFEGQAIAAMLERYKGVKNCYIDGICASIATKIPFACDNVYFAKGAYFMIHRASGIAFGTADDMLKMADTMEQIERGLITTYKTNSRMSEEEIWKKMKDETWYTSDTINNDFNFTIVGGKQIAACVSEETLKNFVNKPEDITVENKANESVKLEFALL